MSWYGAVMWVVLAAGLVPAAWFVLSWTPNVTRLRSLEAFDTGGWVHALLLVYLFQAGVYLVRGTPEPTDPWLAAARIALGIALDAVIIARALLWRRVRRREARTPRTDRSRLR